MPGKSLQLNCGEAVCCLEFATFSGFRKHLKRVNEAGEVLLCVEDDAVVHNAVGQPSNTDVATCSKDSYLPVPSKNTTDLCASAIAQLQAAGVRHNKSINSSLTMEEVVQDIQDQVKESYKMLIFRKHGH